MLFRLRFYELLFTSLFGFAAARPSLRADSGHGLKHSPQFRIPLSAQAHSPLRAPGPTPASCCFNRMIHRARDYPKEWAASTLCPVPADAHPLLHNASAPPGSLSKAAAVVAGSVTAAKAPEKQAQVFSDPLQSFAAEEDPLGAFAKGAGKAVVDNTPIGVTTKSEVAESSARIVTAVPLPTAERALRDSSVHPNHSSVQLNESTGCSGSKLTPRAATAQTQSRRRGCLPTPCSRTPACLRSGTRRSSRCWADFRRRGPSRCRRRLTLWAGQSGGEQRSTHSR